LEKRKDVPVGKNLRQPLQVVHGHKPALESAMMKGVDRPIKPDARPANPQPQSQATT
jgi:hypothetical protein